MTKKAVVKFAEEDTPNSVNVPPTWAGIITWAFGRFGISVVFIYAAYMVYQDQRADRHLLIDSYKENMTINQQSNKILLELKTVIESQTRLIENSYHHKMEN